MATMYDQHAAACFGRNYQRVLGCTPVGGVTCTAAASMPVGFMYALTRYSSIVTTLSIPPSFQYAAGDASSR